MKIIVAILTLMKTDYMSNVQSLIKFNILRDDERLIARFADRHGYDSAEWNDVVALVMRLQQKKIDLLNDQKFNNVALIRRFREQYLFVLSQTSVNSTHLKDPSIKRLKRR